MDLLGVLAVADPAPFKIVLSPPDLSQGSFVVLVPLELFRILQALGGLRRLVQHICVWLLDLRKRVRAGILYDLVLSGAS